VIGSTRQQSTESLEVDFPTAALTEAILKTIYFRHRVHCLALPRGDRAVRRGHQWCEVKRPAEPNRALVRVAITGIYLVSGVTRDVQRAARVRATSEGTSLRRVLVRALREYAVGTWTPQSELKGSGNV